MNKQLSKKGGIFEKIIMCRCAGNIRTIAINSCSVLFGHFLEAIRRKPRTLYTSTPRGKGLRCFRGESSKGLTRCFLGGLSITRRLEGAEISRGLIGQTIITE